MRSLGWGGSNDWGRHQRGRDAETDIHRGRHHVTTEAETGDLCLQAKERQGLPQGPEAGGEPGTDSFTASERASPANTFFFFEF